MTRPHWKHDLEASIVVFLVALPLCLGIAHASGAPLSAGLVAGVIGGLVVGFFSDSSISVSGPAAGLTVIVLNGISILGSFELFTYAVALAGVLQILFALLRGGAIGNYFPSAVVRGMLAAIGIILIIKQAPQALGWKEDGINFSVMMISLVSLLLLIGFDKVTKKIPAALVAVVIATLLSLLLGLPASELVQIPLSGLQENFTTLRLPGMEILQNPEVWQVAVTLALVASLETLLCIDAADRMDPLKRVTSRNRELFAQGVGNGVSGLLSGLPITAVIVRTTANVNAGAKTKYSAIFHGAWLLLFVSFIPGVLNHIPLAVLACILLLTGYKLAHPSQLKQMYRRGWQQLFIFFTTIIAIVMTDLLLGIGIGFALALLFEITSPPLACLEEVTEEGRHVVRFTRNVSFLHKARLHKLLADIPVEREVHFRGLKDVRMHVDVHELILDYQMEGEKKGMVVVVEK